MAARGSCHGELTERVLSLPEIREAVAEPFNGSSADITGG